MLKRIKQIVSANINHLIEKAEDPERMLKQLIREMDENIINLRMKVAKGIAAEKRLARRTEETKAAVQTWQNNSEAAVAEGDDDLARKAIARRLYQESTLAELQEQHKKALAVSQTMKEHLRLLENKIQEARRKKEVLVARKRSAEVQKSVLDTAQKFARISKQTESYLADAAFVDTASSLDSFEDEVVGLETEVEAMREVLNGEPTLDAVFEESKKQEEIEGILREIKKKVRARDGKEPQNKVE
jgi:phage shock protein A